ncbi:MAG: hypothetical protein JWP63_5576 [Candidatus Solibacter sp.]|nr:hypothetical protein [Candidatus Solibacter sp.]
MRLLSLFSLTVIYLTSSGIASAASVGLVQTNLASDQPGVANFTDPTLINAWGLISSGASPFWLGVNGSGISELYTGAGVKQGLVVGIPGDGSVTGVAFSGVANSFNGNLFLFASEDGTVSGWRGALGTNAETLVLSSVSNVYKGLSDALIGGNEYAYLANFRSGAVDVLKGNAAAPNLTGTFTDPNLPSGYAPFNVMNLGGLLYVSYALQDGAKHDDVAAPGNGVLDVFDLQGNFVRRLVSQGGVLNSPWGLALAPVGFGDVGGDLLVGNFGDGTINAFNPTSGALVQTLKNVNGSTLSIDGLWALQFGNGGQAGSANTLFFTAGPEGETHGLFGQLVAAPEPGTWALAAGALALFLKRRR